MIVKDAEAPDYECPQAMNSEEYVYCRGSRCMAWRWADPFNEGEGDLPASWRSTTHGYCGLAGRP